MPADPGSRRTRSTARDAGALSAADLPLDLEPPRVRRRTAPIVVARAAHRAAMLVVGLTSLANGAALVFHIVGGLPLLGLLSVTWASAVIAVAGVAAVGGRAARVAIVSYVAVGLVVGLAATLAYDATKALLSQLDPSPYDPFEATRIFGRILLGETAAPAAVTVAGWGFHLANGCTFTIAFAALFARNGHVTRRRGILTGLGWALFLETFQLVLYPDWLSIGFIDEFRQISFLSHVVFGAIIGLFAPAGLRWSARRMVRSESGAR